MPEPIDLERNCSFDAPVPAGLSSLFPAIERELAARRKKCARPLINAVVHMGGHLYRSTTVNSRQTAKSIFIERFRSAQRVANCFCAPPETTPTTTTTTKWDAQADLFTVGVAFSGLARIQSERCQQEPRRAKKMRSASPVFADVRERDGAKIITARLELSEFAADFERPNSAAS